MIRSKAILTEQLKRLARVEVQSWIDRENKNNNENYSLLMGESITLTGEVLSLSSGQKIGDSASEIEMR